MKILGIDTSTKFLCLGAYNEGRMCQSNIDADRLSSSLLVLHIERVLGALGWRVSDIDYIACGLGPGSFTGTRVAVSTAKGLAWPFKKPIIGLSTLDIIARNLSKRALDLSGEAVVAMDARRGLIYTCVFRLKQGAIERKSGYMLLSKEDFLKGIKPGSLILGDAAGLYREEILKNVKAAVILEREYWYPRGQNIIEAALENIRHCADTKQKARIFKDAFNINPIYLYPAACQIKERKQ